MMKFNDFLFVPKFRLGFMRTLFGLEYTVTQLCWKLELKNYYSLKLLVRRFDLFETYKQMYLDKQLTHIVHLDRKSVV